MTSEERIRELEHRAVEIAGEIQRLDVARATMSKEIRDLFRVRADDARLLLVWLGALTLISFIEAIAIIALWWRR